MIWILSLGALAAVAQLAFDVIEEIQIRRERKARLADEQRLADDEARIDANEGRSCQS